MKMYSTSKILSLLTGILTLSIHYHHHVEADSGVPVLNTTTPSLGLHPVHTEAIERNEHPRSLQLEVKIDGVDQVLELERNDGLFHTTYTEQHHTHNNEGHIEYQALNQSFDINKDNCHYQGVVSGQSDSMVRVSTCNGINGMIVKDQKIYVIQPGDVANRTSNGAIEKDSSVRESMDAISQPHNVHEFQDVLQAMNFQCGSTHDAEQMNKYSAFPQAIVSDKVSSDVLPALGADGNTRYIEYLVVNDHARYGMLGVNTESTSASIMNVVSGIYSKAGFVDPIQVVLVGQITWSAGDPYTVPSAGAGKVMVQGTGGLLDTFNNWQSQNPGKIPHHDTAQLFSGNEFESNILGLAGVGTMCMPSNSGSVTQVTQSTTVANAVITAHETGHLLGAQHDSYGNSCPSNGYVMAAVAGTGTDFSSCSKNYINIQLQGNGDSCLLNKPGAAQPTTTPSDTPTTAPTPSEQPTDIPNTTDVPSDTPIPTQQPIPTIPSDTPSDIPSSPPSNGAGFCQPTSCSGHGRCISISATQGICICEDGWTDTGCARQVGQVIGQSASPVRAGALSKLAKANGSDNTNGLPSNIQAALA